MPAYQEIPRPGRPRGTDQENILQMYRYQHRLAELIETAINTLGDAGDRNIEQTAQVEKIQREEKERVNQLKSTTRVLNTTIQQTNAELNLKAPQEDVDDLKEQVSLAGIRIDEANAQISLKASQTEVDGLSGRVSQAEILIDGANAAIELKASQTTVDALGQRVSNAEVLIDGANASIALKASQATVDALGQRVSSAEVLIDGANAAIELKASKDDLNSVSLRLDAQAKTIEAKADLILLDGYVKASELETSVLEVIQYANLSDVDVEFLDASDALIATLDSNTITTNTLSVGGLMYSAHSHAVTVDGGTVTLGEVSSTGGSFNIADTQFYKDGVSAARNSVTLSVGGWYGGSNTVTASNGKTATVSLPPFSTSGGDSFNSSHQTTVYFYTGSVNGYLASKTVDATSVYDEGYAAGYQAAKDAVEVTAGVSWSNPAQYYAMVRYWGRATIDGEEVGYAASSESKNISGYV